MIGRQWAPVVVFLVIALIMYIAIAIVFDTKRKTGWGKVKQWHCALINWGVFVFTFLICVMCAGIVGFLAFLGTYAFLVFVTTNLCCDIKDQ